MPPREYRAVNMTRQSPCAQLSNRAKACWQILKGYWRILNGDAAYHRYLAHWHAHHPDGGEPLTRAAFFNEEVARRWNGVRRCC